MAQAAGELMEQGAPAFKSAVPILSQLLKAETSGGIRQMIRLTGVDQTE
jgi:hypothetical protein